MTVVCQIAWLGVFFKKLSCIFPIICTTSLFICCFHYYYYCFDEV